jgi:ribosome biogenesis GTPase
VQSQLAGLGRRPDLIDELAQLGEPDLIPGRVLAQHRGHWLVGHADAIASPASPEDDPPVATTSEADGWQQTLVQARARVYDNEPGPPVTGDWVAIDAAGAISHVLPRHGTIVRHDVGSRSQAQVLAANVDLALVIEALPEPNLRRAERLLALATAGGVRAVLVLTKSDLDPEAELVAPQAARDLGLLDAHAVSVVEGSGLGPLTDELEVGATTVLLGLSGAGKSTLVNALLGEERQATQPVRAGDGRGRHTTVVRELIPLPTGALLIDTPGIRRANLWEGTGTAFTDIDELAANCRFADCGHDSEPGCAVRDVVDAERLEAWRTLGREQARLDDRRGAAREREQLGREHARAQRAARRLRDGDE